MNESPATPSTRADQWLWAARFFKTRALAKQAIEGGKILLNDAACKPAKAVRPGDRLRVSRGDERMEVEVLGISARRGSPAIAQALYRESEASRVARLAAREHARLTGAGLSHPDSKPDKRARRLIRQFIDGD